MAWLPNVDCDVKYIQAGSAFPESAATGILLKPIDYEPSGEPPQRVRVRAVEVLS